jgi:hypothetical protein
MNTFLNGENIDLSPEGPVVDQLVAWLETQTRRRIHLLPINLPPGLYGAWISDQESPNEYIFYNAAVPALLQTHIQLHELSHLICQHPTLQVTGAALEETLQGLQNGSITPAGLEASLACTPSAHDREIEAENMALLIQCRHYFQNWPAHRQDEQAAIK